MRNILLFITISIALMSFARIPHKYYVGNTEVDEVFWNSIPDSIRDVCASEIWDHDTLVLERLRLPIEYYLDSIDGSYIITARSEAVIAAFREQMRDHQNMTASRCYRVRVGDTVANFAVMKNPGGMIVNDILHNGKCYLLNFWATWCGNCLLELLPGELPLIADRFAEDKDFVFLPICIDSTVDDLKKFFNSAKGERWKHLEYLTVLDMDRRANGIFTEPGHMPLTVVIGKDGRIRYIRMGRISTSADYEELTNAISSGLTDA